MVGCYGHTSKKLRKCRIKILENRFHLKVQKVYLNIMGLKLITVWFMAGNVIIKTSYFRLDRCKTKNLELSSYCCKGNAILVHHLNQLKHLFKDGNQSELKVQVQVHHHPLNHLHLKSLVHQANN